MGYTATDIATIPAVDGAGKPYNWYVFLLPGPFKNFIRQELIDNFRELARQVGKGNLVVEGADIDDFHTEVIRKYALYLQGYDKDHLPLPSLLVTDTAPAKLKVENGNTNARMIIFPLASTYLKDGMLSDFLRQLCATLQDAQAFDDIAALTRETIKQKWGWIHRYFEIKPNFCGMGINFNEILNDIIDSR